MPSVLFAQSQAAYFVSFIDKPESERLIKNPSDFLSQKALDRRKKYSVVIDEKDIPVNKDYLDALTKFPVKYHGSSKWLNGAIISTEKSWLSDSIKNLRFVSSVIYIGKYTTEPSKEQNINKSLNSITTPIQEYEYETGSEEYYGKSFKQNELIKVPFLHSKNLKGNGILISVIDAGFKNTGSLEAMRQLFLEKKVLKTWDFVTQESDVFGGDFHGTCVLSCMAANLPGEFVGTAPAAQYILLRTEVSKTEYPIEEYFWALAAEMSDSMGCDIISTSLGYSQFDDKSLGYSYKQFDGISTTVSLAAQIAVSRGISVVCSAGNEGTISWKYIVTPADAKDVITIGAVGSNGEYASFSSVGPSADGRLKPEMAVMGKNIYAVWPNGKILGAQGTSYSCPIFAGALACLMQAFPMAEPKVLKHVLELSSNKSTCPDTLTGYGIPDFELAYKLLSNTNKNNAIIHINSVSSDSVKVYFNLDKSVSTEITIKEKKVRNNYLSSQNFYTREGINVVSASKLKAGIYVIEIALTGRNLKSEFEVK